jgi:hypothetical protein
MNVPGRFNRRPAPTRLRRKAPNEEPPPDAGERQGRRGNDRALHGSTDRPKEDRSAWWYVTILGHHRKDIRHIMS